MQRLGRVRLRHLHLPALPGAWRRGLHRDGAGLRHRAHRLQRQGRAPSYCAGTEGVAGVRDMRFQELMPDTLHWLGITHIDRFASMSDMKINALRDQGITIGETVALPEELVPADARVEIEAKVAAGYLGGEAFRTDAPSIGRSLVE